MKPRSSILTLSALALAASVASQAVASTDKTVTLTRTPDPIEHGFRPKKLLVSQPTRNQRKIRKARRQRAAAGDRRAFN